MLRWFILLFIAIVILFIMNQCSATFVFQHGDTDKKIEVSVDNRGSKKTYTKKELKKEAKKPKHR